MLKTIGGIVVGYIAMVVFVAFTYSIAFFLLGVDRSFRPGTYDVTALWLLVSLVLSVFSALIGGKVCRLISERPAAVRILASLVLILGLLAAIRGLRSSAEIPLLRADNISTFQAARYAAEPHWFAFVIPVIGVVGVLIGGQRKT